MSFRRQSSNRNCTVRSLEAPNVWSFIKFHLVSSKNCSWCFTVIAFLANWSLELLYHQGWDNLLSGSAGARQGHGGHGDHGSDVAFEKWSHGDEALFVLNFDTSGFGWKSGRHLAWYASMKFTRSAEIIPMVLSCPCFIYCLTQLKRPRISSQTSPIRQWIGWNNCQVSSFRVIFTWLLCVYPLHGLVTL